MTRKDLKGPEMDEFRELLRKHGFKNTPQRLAVHEAMLQLGHGSADTVTEEIKKAGLIKITTSSVYNILNQLADAGIYRRRMSNSNKMYFDPCTARHLHLYDEENNAYYDILDDELYTALERWLARKRFKGFKVSGFDLQVICRPSRRGKQPSIRKTK